MRERTQINAIREHLKKNKSITSWEAIEQYGATRLSGIIYILKHKEGCNKCNIAKYELVKGD